MLVLEQEGSAAHPTSSPAAGDKTAKGVERPIRCRQCETPVADHGALLPIASDRVDRVFFNAAGYLHDVLTLARVQNLDFQGPASTEFSWFPGYAWELGFCAGCHHHLGWRFIATDNGEPAVFYGLRRAELAGL